MTIIIMKRQEELKHRRKYKVQTFLPPIEVPKEETSIKCYKFNGSFANIV